MLLCLGLVPTRASPILTESGTIPSNYQHSASSFHQEHSFSLNPGRGNFETKLNVQPPLAVDQSLKNAPGVTTTFIDENGHRVTQVRKETVKIINGQHVRAFEIEETKQLPNGYSKSFKTEYSSSSAAQYQPTAFVQKPLTPLNVDNYYASGTSINGETGRFGQYSQNFQGPSVSGSSNYFGTRSNLIPATGQINANNAPASLTTTYQDQDGNLVTTVRKETVNNNGGINTRIMEKEETKQLPNGYSTSYKQQYSSSSAI